MSNQSETGLITSKPKKCENLTMNRNWCSFKVVSLRSASCSCCYFAQFFQCASGHEGGGGGVKNQPVHWYMSEGLREAILFGELAVTDSLAMDLELV